MKGDTSLTMTQRWSQKMQQQSQNYYNRRCNGYKKDELQVYNRAFLKEVVNQQAMLQALPKNRFNLLADKEVDMLWFHRQLQQNLETGNRFILAKYLVLRRSPGNLKKKKTLMKGQVNSSVQNKNGETWQIDCQLFQMLVRTNCNF